MIHGDDIKKQTTKPTVKGNTLLRKFSHYSLEVKLELFRSHCYSFYYKLMWLLFKVTTMNRLTVCHNDVLRTLPSWTSSSLAFTRNGVKNPGVIHWHCACKLKSRVERSENSIITSVRQSSALVLCDRRGWMYCLCIVQGSGAVLRCAMYT